MIIEPVLGEGGYMPAPKAFLEGVVERCRRTASSSSPTRSRAGSGAPGRWFAVEHYDVEPDILCMAKGIASGFPFSALGTRRELDDQWPKGSHGGTYGGNPMGCAAALATIEVMSEPGFMENVRARGEQLSAALTGLHERLSGFGPGARAGADGRHRVRGRGAGADACSSTASTRAT